jgi:hypothetical protein
MTRILAVVVALALIAGCTPGAPSPGTASPTSAPTPTATASGAEPTTPAPEPTTALDPFDCELPASLPATIDRAQIVDVRVGTHPDGAPGYDRIVFEFENGIPEVDLREGTPPFTQDPSGLPLAVDGDAFLVLVMHGGTAVTAEGTLTYEGRTDFSPAFPTLTQLKEAGDFEAVSEWVIGMTGPACHRLFTLDSPSRLVIDLQHP